MSETSRLRTKAETLAWVLDILDRRAYRIGWGFDAWIGDTTGWITLRIQARVEDSDHPGMLTLLDIRSPVPEYALEDERAFDRWLIRRLIVASTQEVKGWYRKASPTGDGRLIPVFDPRALDADTPRR